VGETVSLRVTTPAGPSEVLGVVVSLSADALVVRRRDGSEVTVDVTSVTAGRVVPPGPARTVGIDELERIAALGWRPLETATLGGWLLRAGGGFTGRANSALVLGDPGMELSAAIAAVTAWYAERRLPPRLALPDGQLPAGLEDLLARRGWTVATRTHVMTAEIAPVVRSRPLGDGPVVRLDPEPDEAWLAAYRAEGGPLPPAARQLLVNHPDAVFASVREDDRCVAIARASVDGRWAGLFAVEAAPDRRRRGLAAAASLEALRWSVRHGARRAYLQTAADNQPAVALFSALGFTVHHDYRYAARHHDRSRSVEG
jgi:GNAT superfamily N-acetyltransferase